MEYYAWRVRGKPVEVRLNLPMLRYMVPWIRDPALHSTEAFGLLLGSIKRRWGRFMVLVDDFEPFDPAKLSGRPLAPRGSELSVVGLYRRHSAQELKLDRLDASFIQSSFAHPGMVYLLVAAAPAGPDRAAFFIQEHGDVHGYANYAEFPFDPEYLSGPVLDAPRLRRWIPAAGLAACAFALGSWFLWLRNQPAPAASAAPPPAPVQTQAQTAPEPPKTVEPAVSPNSHPAKHRVTKKHRKTR